MRQTLRRWLLAVITLASTGCFTEPSHVGDGTLVEVEVGSGLPGGQYEWRSLAEMFMPGDIGEGASTESGPIAVGQSVIRVRMRKAASH